MLFPVYEIFQYEVGQHYAYLVSTVGTDGLVL